MADRCFTRGGSGDCVSAADTEGLERFAYCGGELKSTCSQHVSVSHDSYSTSGSTFTVTTTSIPANEVCVIEIEDAEYNESSMFDIKVAYSTPSDFDVEVFVSRGLHPSEYARLTGDKINSVEVVSEEGEKLFLIVYPRTYLGVFQAEVTHRGEATKTRELT